MTVLLLSSVALVLLSRKYSARKDNDKQSENNLQDKTDPSSTSITTTTTTTAIPTIDTAAQLEEWRELLRDKEQALFYCDEDSSEASGAFWFNLFGGMSEINAQLPVFHPTFLLSNSHLQTILNAKFRALDRTRFEQLVEEREEFSMLPSRVVGGRHVGGEQMCTAYLDWFRSPVKPRATIFIVPGVFSGTDGIGVRHFILHAMSEGYECVVLNFTSTHTNHAKHRTVIPGVTHTTKDLNVLMQHLKKRIASDPHGERPLVAVGISLGANILTKYLGEIGEQKVIAREMGTRPVDEHVDIAISIANPFDLEMATNTLRKSAFSRYIYDKTLVKRRKMIIDLNLERLLEQFSTPADYTASEVDREELIKQQRKLLQTMESSRDLDQHFTLKWLQMIRDSAEAESTETPRPLTLEEFYKEQSSIDSLKYITVPLLLVNAFDDPISLAQCWPSRSVIQANPNVAFLVTRHGGHVGWLSNFQAFVRSDSTWIERVILHNVLGKWLEQRKETQIGRAHV